MDQAHENKAIAARGIKAKPFSPETERDAVKIVNEYIAGWPYSRPLDADVVHHWKTLGASYQPANMLVAYRGVAPRAFVHGERVEKLHKLHLLAMVPGAVEEATWLLNRVEEGARAAGVEKIRGPNYESYLFYGGYVLGREPFHPHWATGGTEAFVRAGFRISHAAVIMVTALEKDPMLDAVPAGYEVVEVPAMQEFGARTFRYVARFGGGEVATCTGRFYPSLRAPLRGSVGQLGWVGTNEPHRAKGLARALVQQCLKRLKEWGAAEALISTGLDNLPALRCYENASFERRHLVIEWSKDLTDAR